MSVGKKITISIISVILIIAIAVASFFIVKNFNAIKTGIGGQELFTREEYEEAYLNGYAEGKSLGLMWKTEAETYKVEIESLRIAVDELENKDIVSQEEILSLIEQVSILNAHIDVLDNIIEDNNEEILDLKAQVLDLKHQLFNVFENQYALGFEDGVNSIDIQEVYNIAYDNGYFAGYSKQEKLYENINKNINVVWDGEKDITWYTSDKMSEDSTYDNLLDWYIIYKPSQLAGLSLLVDSGVSFENETIVLMNNMILNNKDIDFFNLDNINNLNNWDPIGKALSPFKGVFYGSNHYISGLYINSESYNNIGLFGCVENAELYAFGVFNSYIKGLNKIGVIGSAYNSKIYNISSEIKIEGNSAIGGLVGLAENLEISDIYIMSDIFGVDDTGGLIGFSSKINIKNVNLKTLIDINSSANTIGGLIGKLSFRDSISNINNINANVSIKRSSGSGYLGGFIGYYYNSSSSNEITILNVNDVSLLYSSLNSSLIFGTAKNTTSSLPLRLYGSNFKYKVINQNNFDILDGNYSNSDVSHIFEEDSNISESLLKHYLSKEIIEEASCEEPGLINYNYYYSSFVKEEIIPALGHNFIEIERVEAIVDVDGYILYECSNCGSTYTEIIPALSEMDNFVFRGLDINGNITNVEEDIISYMIGTGTKSVHVSERGNGYIGESEDIIIPSFYKNKPISYIGNFAFAMLSIKNVSFDENSQITSFGDGVFRDCPNLTTITIPNSVIDIGSQCFSFSENLKSVILSNNIKKIGRTFDFCYGLEEIIIPDSVEIIGSGAFEGCSSLTTITIPNSVKVIGERAFYRCSSLENITIPSSVSSIENDAFHSTKWYDLQNDGLIYIGKFVYKYKGSMPLNTSITLNSDTKGIVGDAFAYCSNLTSITIPSSVISIGRNAFWGCSSLTAITIPNSVKSIGNYAFGGCSILEFINISDNLIEFGAGVFNDTKWYDLQNDGVVYIGKIAYGYKGNMPLNTTITLKSNTKIIASEAFAYCSNLISITIPSSVGFIGEGAFYNCFNLEIICLSTTPPTIYSFEYYIPVFGLGSFESIYVPAESVEAYKNADGWTNYSNKIFAI